MKKLLLSMTLLMGISSSVFADAVIVGGVVSSSTTTWGVLAITDMIDSIGKVEAQKIVNDIAIYDLTGELTNSLAELLENIESTDTQNSIQHLSQEMENILEN